MKHAITLSILLAWNGAHAEVIAFIGSPLAAELSDKNCMAYIEQPEPGAGFENICMDRAFKLRYSVKEVLFGNLDKDTVDFIGFYHYWGMPRYTLHEPALVIISTEKDNLILRSISPVDEKSGEWIVCEEWDENDEYSCLKEESALTVAKELINEI